MLVKCSSKPSGLLLSKPPGLFSSKLQGVISSNPRASSHPSSRAPLYMWLADETQEFSQSNFKLFPTARQRQNWQNPTKQRKKGICNADRYPCWSPKKLRLGRKQMSLRPHRVRITCTFTPTLSLSQNRWKWCWNVIVAQSPLLQISMEESYLIQECLSTMIGYRVGLQQTR